MNKKLYALLVFASLCSCKILPKKFMRSNVMTIKSDRKDVVEIPIAIDHNKNFCVKPLEYSSLIVKNPTDIVSNVDYNQQNYINKINSSSQDKWVTKMRAHSAEIASQVNGVLKSGSFNITSIPIGFSYKMELDKPRKKAKKI